MSYDGIKRSKWKVKLQNWLVHFSKEVSLPVHKLVQEVMFGTLSSGSLQLASISRALKEPISLHGTEKRLSRMLGLHRNLADKLESYQLTQVANLYTKGMVLGIDPGDLNRDGARKSGRIGWVRDGSTGDIVKGYPLLNITARHVRNRTTLPILNRLYSCKKPSFRSENTEIIHAMKKVEQYLRKPLWVMDRGGDRGKLWDAWFKGKQKVLVRITNQRYWQWRDELIPAYTIAKYLPLKHIARLRKGRTVRFGITEVRLKEYPHTKLFMIIIRHGYKDPLILVTNKATRGKAQGQWMIKAYMERWACEEGYRFTKQCFGAEKMMARSYHTLRNLIALASLSWAFLACESQSHQLMMYGKPLKPDKPPSFIFYRLLEGWRNLFKREKKGLYHTLRGIKPPPLPLFQFL